MEDLKQIQEFFSKSVKENSRRSPDFILTEPAEIKYTESFGSGIKAPGVLHHANEGVFLGAEGAYIIVLPGGTFYVDEDKEEAIRIYPLKDQSRELQLALDYTPFSPKYETWKSWVKEPKTLGETDIKNGIQSLLDKYDLSPKWFKLHLIQMDEITPEELNDLEYVEDRIKAHLSTQGELEEADLNDPVAMKMRAAKIKADKLAKMRAANAGDDGNDKFFDAAKLRALKKKRAQIMRDMEQEAEMEGGSVADKYGDMLNKIDKAIAMLSEVTEVVDDSRIDNPKFGPSPRKFAELRKQMGDEALLDKIQMLNVNVLLDILDELDLLQESTISEYDVYMPSQEEVDNFFNSRDSLGSHYLNNKPVMGQEGTFNLMPIEPWDEYDYSNWKALQADTLEEVTRYSGFTRNPEDPDSEKFNPTGAVAQFKEDLRALFGKFKGDLKNPEFIRGVAEIMVNWKPLLRSQLDEVQKGHNEKVSKEVFSKLQGKIISYKGEDYKVISSGDAVLKMQDSDGKFKSINLNQFNVDGLIREIMETIELGKNLNEELCPKGEAYRKRRMAAGEKSSAYLSGRAVKVCKGQMSGKKK